MDTLFTYPSVYTLGPVLSDSCINVDSLFAKDTKPCTANKFPTGVNCAVPECGRPSDWPADQPFYLPLDLQDPEVWLRIGAAKPTLDEVTAEEDLQLRVRMRALQRCFGCGDCFVVNPI